MSEHTPGEWVVLDEWMSGIDVGVELEDGAYYHVATARDLDEKTEPNAHLIAAAPDLLEALEDSPCQMDAYNCGREGYSKRDPDTAKHCYETGFCVCGNAEVFAKARGEG